MDIRTEYVVYDGEPILMIRPSFDQMREMVWEDYTCGLISEARLEEMMRVIEWREKGLH